MTEGENMQSSAATATGPGATQNAGAGINPATSDQIADPDKIVAINRDKLANVDDKKIVEACEAMEEIDDERSNLNDKASEIRSSLKSLGIPTAAFNAAYSRFKMGEKKRAELDAGFAKCVKAMEIEYQAGLFD